MQLLLIKQHKVKHISILGFEASHYGEARINIIDKTKSGDSITEYFIRKS